MNETIKAFFEYSTSLQYRADLLNDFVNQGRRAGFELGPEYLKKVQEVTSMRPREKLRIVLIGGFSEGKTSIAAAWSGKLDRSTMNISHAESSDEISIYSIDDKCLLVDTPGLFGSKKRVGGDSGAFIAYKDITNRYLSEAHILLYVMNPSNPVKDSHKVELTWLFRELQLLDRTVFVLSKFDEVADLDDEISYESALRIKQRNVKDRLQTVIGLTATEAASIRIVGVSANPFDQGIDYWLREKSEFLNISRIPLLQQETRDLIDDRMGKIIEDTQKGMITDIVLHMQKKVELDLPLLEKMVASSKSILDELRRSVSRAEDETRENQCKLQEFVVDTFTNLILQARGLSMVTAQEFFDREIGADGIVLKNKLDAETKKRSLSIGASIDQVNLKFSSNLSEQQDLAILLGKQGITYLAGHRELLSKHMILASRDGIVQVGKFFGLDLGGYLRFAPGGATQLAHTLGGAVAALGVLVHVWESYEETEAERRFKASISRLIESFEEMRRRLVASIANYESFVEECAPQLLELREKLSRYEASCEKDLISLNNKKSWHANGFRLMEVLNEPAPSKRLI